MNHRGSCRRFNFHEIELATNEFDESLAIGSGGFGKVYKGTIFNGSTPVAAAIKRLDSMSNQGAKEFWAEIEILSKLHHSHLVTLFGYCDHENEKIIVYEYISNGSLKDHLMNKLGTTLSWHQRLKICIGTARGLDYLHTGFSVIIHGDINSSNILLDKNWVAKISDFGLSRIEPIKQNLNLTYVNTIVQGTVGYIDPEYLDTGRLTRNADVYAFGVVLFEVLCSRGAVDLSIDAQDLGLARWAQQRINSGSLNRIIDSHIRSQVSPKSLQNFVLIAKGCLHTNPFMRPTMAEVVLSLEGLLTLQQNITKLKQPVLGTVVGRILAIFSNPVKGENSAQDDSKLSIDINDSSRSSGNVVRTDANTFTDTRDASADIGHPNPSIKVFSFADLETATSNFSLYMPFGRGCFGKVFLGWVDKYTFAPSRDGIGIPVAVKRRYLERSQRHAKWLAYANLLGRLSHQNIVSLLGYCSDEQNYFLVYEYLQNRSLDRFLYGRNEACDIVESLSWGTRIMIMIGVARGLTYLHLTDQVICGVLKSSDILLDQNYNAKLGDFGLARFGPKPGETVVSTHVMGPLGYIDKHYYTTGSLSMKTDIYGFGAVLLETLTGLQSWDLTRPVEHRSLVYWVTPFLAKRKEVREIMDPRLEQNYPLEGAFKCAELALRCVADKPKDRPSSEEVLKCLEQIYSIK